jgi:hypothetical protein
MFKMNSPALPHTNGSHTGTPRMLFESYAHAPVVIDTASAAGPKTNAVPYTTMLVAFGRIL